MFSLSPVPFPVLCYESLDHPLKASGLLLEVGNSVFRWVRFSFGEFICDFVSFDTFMGGNPVEGDT